MKGQLVGCPGQGDHDTTLWIAGMLLSGSLQGYNLDHLQIHQIGLLWPQITHFGPMPLRHMWLIVWCNFFGGNRCSQQHAPLVCNGRRCTRVKHQREVALELDLIVQWILPMLLLSQSCIHEQPTFGIVVNLSCIQSSIRKWITWYSSFPTEPPKLQLG